jgi:hypothetical protein
VQRTRWDVSPLKLGMIAAYYNISYVTVEVYTLSLKERAKIKGLLEVVASSAEFERIPIRRHEEVLLWRIDKKCAIGTRYILLLSNTEKALRVVAGNRDEIFSRRKVQ